MPNAAEIFIQLTDKISPPLNFFVKFLLGTGTPESFEIFNELNREADDILEISTDTLYLIKESSVFFLAGMLDERGLDGLIEMIRDRDVRLKREAAMQFRMLLDQGVLPNIKRVKRELFFVDADKLSHNDEIVFRVVNSLINILKSDNPSVREWTVVALGTRKDLCVVNALIEVLADENPTVRKKASIQLGMIGNPLAVEPLIALLEDTDADVREQSAHALGSINDSRAIEPLIKLIEIEKNIRVKRTAIAALGNIENPKVIEFMSKLFEDNNQCDIGIKISTATILAARDNLKAEKFLMGLLNSSDLHARREVAFILASGKNPEVVNILIELLKTPQYQGWSWEHRFLGEMLHLDIVKNAFVNALNKGEISRDSAIKVLSCAGIRNCEAYLQYLLKTKNNNFSYTSFLAHDDLDKVAECCRAGIKSGDEAIAILNENNEKQSIHAHSCPEIKAAYWS